MLNVKLFRKWKPLWKVVKLKVLFLINFFHHRLSRNWGLWSSMPWTLDWRYLFSFSLIEIYLKVKYHLDHRLYLVLTLTLRRTRSVNWALLWRILSTWWLRQVRWWRIFRGRWKVRWIKENEARGPNLSNCALGFSYRNNSLCSIIAIKGGEICVFVYLYLCSCVSISLYFRTCCVITHCAVSPPSGVRHNSECKGVQL